VLLPEGQTFFDVIYGPLSFNDSATIGVQKDGTDFTQYSFTDEGRFLTRRASAKITKLP
jgi:hypothetical protein